jgi:hypothetical protein
MSDYCTGEAVFASSAHNGAASPFGRLLEEA